MESMVPIDNRIGNFRNKNHNLKLGFIIASVLIVLIIFFIYLSLRSSSSKKIVSESESETAVIRTVDLGGNSGLKIINNSKTPISIKSLKRTEAKAKKAGYSIYWEVIWNRNNKDASGRYILASKERVVNGWIDAFGWQDNPNKNNGQSRVTGVFSNLENVKGTKDQYFFLMDMRNRDTIRIRIPYEQTVVYINNLDYGPLNNNITPVEKIDFIENISSEKLSVLLKKGDIVSAYVPLNSDHSLVKDSVGVPIAELLEIRRFGGLNSINSELKDLK
jgi:hypothetical protein